jgi:uncharacterized RDD family membrane protein YckC
MHQSTQNTGLPRRIAAIIYDLLLVAAVIFIATIPFIAIRGGEPVEPGDVAYRMTLLAVVYAFFVGFWSRKGRTLGMQSWGLQLEDDNGAIPSVAKCSLRFLAAFILPGVVALIVYYATNNVMHALYVGAVLVGLGFLWQLIDKGKLAWHDRISGTRLVYYPKEPRAEP